MNVVPLGGKLWGGDGDPEGHADLPADYRFKNRLTGEVFVKTTGAGIKEGWVSLRGAPGAKGDKGADFDPALFPAPPAAEPPILAGTTFDYWRGDKTFQPLLPVIQAAIDAEIAELVGAAPATIDQIFELAGAIGNDPNFAVTIASTLALKAPLASPALTDVPTAPTAAPGTNTTQLATTAFVAAGLATVGGILELTRTLPPVLNDYVEIGTFTAANAAHGNSFRLTVTGTFAGFSLSKSYLVNSSIISGGAWVKLAPESESQLGGYGGVDFDVDYLPGSGNLRMRRKDALGGSYAGIKIRVENTGHSATVFTPQTATGSAAAPTAFYSANKYLTGVQQLGVRCSPIAQFQVGNPGVGLDAGYSIINWNGVGGMLPGLLVTNTIAGAALPTPEPALVLGRSGQNGATYNNYVEFKIGRYENVFPNPRTILVIALTHVGGVAVDAMTLRSDGQVIFVGKMTAAALNLPVGTPAALVDGDIWREDNTNTGLKVRVAGVTKTITLS